MIFLLLSILCNALLFIILKYFDRFGISTLQGIVVNYAVAGTTGLITSPEAMRWQELDTKPWNWVPPLMGLLFISIFLLIARTAQTIGISTASVANKMSVIIPVLTAVIFLGESLDMIQVAGIALALLSVWMTSVRKEKQASGLKAVWLPVIVFAGSGVIDALVNYSQDKLFNAPGDGAFFVTCCFFVAFIAGISIAGWRIIKGSEKFAFKNIIAGIVLGLPNYFSIWCMVKALQQGKIDSSVLYPMNNMGIVLASSFGAMLLFRERLSKLNWMGIFLSVAAIVLMARESLLQFFSTPR